MNYNKKEWYKYEHYQVAMIVIAFVIASALIMFWPNISFGAVSTDSPIFRKANKEIKNNALSDSVVTFKTTGGNYTLYLIDSIDGDTVGLKVIGGNLMGIDDGAVWTNLLQSLSGIALEDTTGNLSDDYIVKYNLANEQWEFETDQIGEEGTGDITAVIAGAGQTGGGTSGSVTMNVIGGNMIAVTSDAVHIDSVALDAFIDSANVRFSDSSGTTQGFRVSASSSTDEGKISWNASLNLFFVGDGDGGTVKFAEVPDTAKALRDDALLLDMIAQNGATDGQGVFWDAGSGAWIVDDQSGSGSPLSVKESGVEIDDNVTVLDFGAGFDLSESPEDEINILVDYTEDPVGLAGADVADSLPANKGGTGRNSLIDDAIILGNTTSKTNYMTLLSDQFIVGSFGLPNGYPRRGELIGGDGVDITMMRSLIDTTTATTFTFSTDYTENKIELSTTNLEVNGRLSVPNGGTGLTIVSTGFLLVGNETGPLMPMLPLGAGQIPISSGVAGTMSLNEIDEGTGIIITNGASTISIAAVLGTNISSGEIIDGTIALVDLSDMGAAAGQILEYSGSVWAPQTPSSDIWVEVLGSPDSLVWATGAGVDDTGLIVLHFDDDLTQIKAPDGDTLQIGVDGLIAMFDSIMVAGIRYPIADGNNGDVFMTNGSGVASFQPPGAGTGTADTLIFNTVESATGTEYSIISNRIKVRPSNGVLISREDSTTFDMMRLKVDTTIIATLDALIDSTSTKFKNSGGELSGNITFSGAQTVDGVDISALNAQVGNIDTTRILLSDRDDTSDYDIIALELKADGDIYVNNDSGNVDATIHFADTDEKQTIHWDPANDQFEISDDLNITGDIELTGAGYIDGNLYINYDETGADAIIYFDDDDIGTPPQLHWDDVSNGFEFSHKVYSASSITAEVNLIAATGIFMNAVQWNTGDNIDGEVIGDNTIDDDAIDWGTGAGQVATADLTDGFDTAQVVDTIQGLITAGGVLLSDIGNPVANNTITMANSQLKLAYTAPNPSDGAFEVEAIGGFQGDLVHIHQHTGNPGAGTDLLHIEGNDADLLALRVENATPGDSLASFIGGAVFMDSLEINGVLRAGATDITGNITVSGTVDGIDIAALDADIAADSSSWNATADALGTSIDSTKISDGDLSLDDLNWRYEYFYLDQVHGWNRALEDSIYLSFPVTNGTSSWLLTDSAGDVGTDADTFMVSGYIPYGAVVETLIIMFQTSHATNAVIDSINFYTSDISDGTFLTDSSHYVDATDRGNTSWTIVAYDITDYTATSGERFAVKFFNKFIADNTAVRIGWIRLACKR